MLFRSPEQMATKHLQSQLRAANAKLDRQDKVLRSTLFTLNHIKTNNEVLSTIMEFLDGHWNLWKDLEAILAEPERGE